MNQYWIAVDWGTTNFRAFLMKDSALIDEVTSAEGILSVQKGAFEAILYKNIDNFLKNNKNIPILMAGMVGSQQGWVETAYQELPATLGDLSHSAVELKATKDNRIWLIPGTQSISQYSLPDVMRGEETQLIGLPEATNYYAIMPGTHSKHCTMVKGEIQTITSFMTGELYSLLIKNSMVGKELSPQIENDEFFLMGVESAQKDIPLTHLIFSARTKRLNKDIPCEFIGSYLSGILIGIEIKAINSKNNIVIISNEKLGNHYLKAGEHLNLQLELKSGDECFLSGAYKLIKNLGGIHV